MTRSDREKQELREMSRKDAVRVVSEILTVYKARGDSGTITVDVRSGKAIWVRPVVTDCPVNPRSSCTLDVIGQLDEMLKDFEARGASGTVTVAICAGQAVEVSRTVELEKVRVG